MPCVRVEEVAFADVVKSEPIIKESCVYSENALRGELERGSVWSVCPVSC